ncbi:hypothetical protein Glove_52g30 [Diversispora epigaea]|uniref:BTB domain-containing protein n=1 Tax=Diversispora epigaea TaxID=1348612 RepID=A0A397JHQ9_9GLOM|nr:hypothetical protein Glove_52g30 [Diversispora epigaea]
MSFKFFDKLSQDFSELLNDKKEHNVVIEVDKEKNKKSFTAHSVVLRYRSSYFDKELENATTNKTNFKTIIKPNKNNIKTIIKPNISVQIFEIILKYIYGGIVNIENTDTKTIYELMINANELEFKELSVKLESYLIESKASWLRTHFSLIYHSIVTGNEFKGLKKFYNDIIAKHPNLIFESGDFTSLQETALVSILKRDDLQFEEIKIWDYIIKWGIAQNPTLPNNLEKWSNENFKALKITLQQCLPLIRYFHISSQDIWNKVKPYERILEKQLWNDIVLRTISPNKPVESLVLPARIISNPVLPSRTISTPGLSSPELPSRTISTPRLTSPELPSRTISTPKLTSPELLSRTISTPRLTSPELPSRTISTPGLPSRVNEPFSTIINKEHVAELSSWIDRISTIYSIANIPYEFQLILRGSRNGFHPKTFWEMCHGHAGTILIAKVAGTDEIIGGYNPLAWENSTGGGYEARGTHMETNNSFIFSLKNGNIRNSTLSRVKDPSKALLYCHSDARNICGPHFGNCEFTMGSNVSDFTQDKFCRCDYNPRYGTFYENPIRTTNGCFSIVDYEVFKINNTKKQIPNCTIR